MENLVAQFLTFFNNASSTHFGLPVFSTIAPFHLWVLYLQVELLPYNAKHAQFKVMPRYKVKAEGDVVSIIDIDTNRHRYKYYPCIVIAPKSPLLTSVTRCLLMSLTCFLNQWIVIKLSKMKTNKIILVCWKIWPILSGIVPFIMLAWWIIIANGLWQLK